MPGRASAAAAFGYQRRCSPLATSQAASPAAWLAVSSLARRMNGTGSWFPGPGGAGGPGGSPGANVDGGGTRPAGPSGSVRAPGGPGAIGTGVPGTFGGG